MKTPFMGTTEVPAERTVREVISLLVQSGARQVATEYEVGGKPTGVSFVLIVAGAMCAFKLPVRTEPVFKNINKNRSQGRTWPANIRKDREQAERVAWRQIYRWLQAQLAMIQTAQVEAHEVFLPYLQDGNGQTLFEVMSTSRFKALPAGSQASQ